MTVSTSLYGSRPDTESAAGRDAGSNAGRFDRLPARFDQLPTVLVPISALKFDDSPRRDGPNEEHCRMLAESVGELPPIVVHRQSMRVVDGTHRVHAAVLSGKREIEARIFDGEGADAFVLAVQMNIAHGLPLTRADRMAAAGRIIDSHARWSNRMIATITGLSAGTISALRNRSTAQDEQSNARIGKDGRIRPVSASSGRIKVREILERKPTASIRQVAKEAGVSPATVHDVRKRLRAGADPVPARDRANDNGAPAERRCSRPPGRFGSKSSDAIDAAVVIASLMRDPALRYSDAGRSLIRGLDACRWGIAECYEIAERIPPHCLDTVANLVREYAEKWAGLAATLERRQNQLS